MVHEQEIARAVVLEDVLAERERQDELWGDQVNNTDETWSVIAMDSYPFTIARRTSSVGERTPSLRKVWVWKSRTITLPQRL